jgi:hypothetical protein
MSGQSITVSGPVNFVASQGALLSARADRYSGRGGCQTSQISRNVWQNRIRNSGKIDLLTLGSTHFRSGRLQEGQEIDITEPNWRRPPLVRLG